MPKITEEQREKLRAQRALNGDYKRCFSTAAGKRVLEHLLLTGGILHEDDTCDPHAALVRKGERRVVRTIFDRVLPDKTSQLEKLQEIANRRYETSS